MCLVLVRGCEIDNEVFYGCFFFTSIIFIFELIETRRVFCIKFLLLPLLYGKRPMCDVVAPCFGWRLLLPLEVSGKVQLSALRFIC